MKRHTRTQRGQALILVALAIVGLVGFAALAIDGGNVFSDRRHSQNASDTAAYASALALVRTRTGEFAGDWKQEGINRAEDNGYSSADGVTEVDVFSCDELPQTLNGYLNTCIGRGMPAGADPQDYVYVHIKSRVKMFFAPVIGWKHVINHTDAVVLAATPKETSLFPGYALVSTMIGCKPNHYNHDPFTVSGNSGTTIVNAGILVNSDCTYPQPAYDQFGSSEVEVDPEQGVCVVGRASSTNTDPPPNEDCSPMDIRMYSLPNPGCGHEGKIREKEPGVYWADPGQYGHNFDFDSIDDVNPAGKLYLQKGIYCFYDGINLQGNWDITTDLDNSGSYDSASEGVLFYVDGGDITFNGTSLLNLHAVDSTLGGFPKEFVNVLLYVPPWNPADIKITGDNGSKFSGTILAPTSYISLSGGTGPGSEYKVVGLDSQIIGYAVTIEGSGTLNINYNADHNMKTKYNPSLAPIN